MKQTWGIPWNKSAEVTYSLKPRFKMQFRHVGTVVPLKPDLKVFRCHHPWQVPAPVTAGVALRTGHAR